MEFFRLLEKLLPNYFKENMAADTENNNINIEPSINQCQSDFSYHSNILETEGNATVNSNEYVSTNIDSSVDKIEECGVTKTLYSLENVSPIEMVTYHNSDQEPMENEKTLIENANIFNNVSGASFVNDIEDRYRRSHSDLDNNILETEVNVTVNSNEYVSTNIDSLIDNIEVFSDTKTFHNLENVIPIEITANEDTYQETMENEISLIEDIILNNPIGVSLVVNDIHDETVVNKRNNDLEEIQIRHEVNKPEVEKKINNTLDSETMQSLEELEADLHIKDEHVFTDDFGIEFINLDEFKDIFGEKNAVNEDLVGNVFKNNENATCCVQKEFIDLNNGINSNFNENIDIIAIDSSTEDEISQKLEIKDTISISDTDETDSDDGYNSSDFEFISETEAKMAGIVINHGIEKYQKLSQTSSEPIIYCFDVENHQGNEESDPGEGSSRQNRPRNEFEDRSYRNNHHIPIGDDYLGLFQGIYNPLMPMSDILFLENKSVRASAMNMQYDGIGFDKQLAMRRHQPDSSEDEFEDEAKESAKKIIKMYPGENRKRRRRYL